MSWKIDKIEDGVRLTPGLCHLGYWVANSFSRAMDDLIQKGHKVYLDLSSVLYTDQKMNEVLANFLKDPEKVVLVGYGKGSFQI